MSKSQEKQQEKQEAIARLRELVKPGDAVYTILRHVSRSGMRRVIDVVVLTKDGPLSVGYLFARALGARFDRDRGGVVVGGCGMDMGFHLVYEGSYRIFDEDPRLGAWQTEQDNRRGLPTDAGYALKQRWL